MAKKKTDEDQIPLSETQNTEIGCRVHDAKGAVNTIHTDPRLKIVVPFIVKLEHGQNGAVNSAADKFQTQTCRHSQMLVSNIRSTLECLQTQTTTQGMGLAFLTESSSGGKARAATDVFNTATAGGAKTGILTNDAWNSFISYYYGKSQASHITDAIGTATCNDRSSVITYKEPSIEDCYYRMLKASEIKLAMAFERDYIILGKSKDQVKQCGNAVTPPAMEWLVQQCVESLS